MTASWQLFFDELARWRDAGRSVEGRVRERSRSRQDSDDIEAA